MIYFTPPSRLEHRGKHPLFGRLLFRQGVSVLKESGGYRQVENPTDEECAAADAVYLGGHVYVVSAEEAESLDSAGYGAYLDGYYGDPGGPTPYGFGPYGAGPYGGTAS